MTLYIYRVGWTYPARNPITDLNLQRVLVVLGFQVDRSDRSDPPVRPVGVARPATWSRPVRPLSSTDQTGLFDQCQFWSSTHCMALNFEIVIDQSALLHIHVIDCIYRYAPFSHPNWVWTSYWAVAGNSVCTATDTGSSCTDLSPLSIRRWSMLVCGFNLDRSIVKRRPTCTWLWHGLLLFDRFSASYHMNLQYT